MYQCTFYTSNTNVETLYTLPHIFTKIPEVGVTLPILQTVKLTPTGLVTQVT